MSSQQLEPESPAFISALVTEHFVLQSMASSTIGESGSRSALYLSTLSSGLFVNEDDPRTAAMGVRYSAWSILFTMASMIGVVNSVLAGAAAALALALGTQAPTPAAAGAGMLIGLLVLAGTLAYQRRRFLLDASHARR